VLCWLFPASGQGQDMTQIVSFVSDDTKKATGKQYQFTFIRFFAIRETSLA
jgi:hypothetical protein